MDERILLTPKEAKRLLGVGTNKIYEIFAQEDFPAIVFGRKKFVRRDALFEWLQKKERGGLNGGPYESGPGLR